MRFSVRYVAIMTYIPRYFVTAEDHVTGGEASGDRSETGQALRLFHSLQQIPDVRRCCRNHGQTNSNYRHQPVRGGVWKI